jgi:hypothetical protein
MAEKTLREQNEEALDLFADLMEPAAEILADPEISGQIGTGVAPVKIIKPAIKNHKGAVIEILARLHGQEPDEYKVNLFMLPIELTRLLTKPEVQDFLSSLAQSAEDDASGSPTENTEDAER